MNVLFSFKVELCVDNTSVTNVVKVEVGLIVVDMDVEVWTMAVDILSPLNVVLDGCASGSGCYALLLQSCYV